MGILTAVAAGALSNPKGAFGGACITVAFERQLFHKVGEGDVNTVTGTAVIFGSARVTAAARTEDAVDVLAVLHDRLHASPSKCR
jgi:hypothetical protein